MRFRVRSDEDASHEGREANAGNYAVISLRRRNYR